MLRPLSKKIGVAGTVFGKGMAHSGLTLQVLTAGAPLESFHAGGQKVPLTISGWPPERELHLQMVKMVGWLCISYLHIYSLLISITVVTGIDVK